MKDAKQLESVAPERGGAVITVNPVSSPPGLMPLAASLLVQRPGVACVSGHPAPVAVAPPMMLLMALAATCRLSTRSVGLYG